MPRAGVQFETVFCAAEQLGIAKFRKFLQPASTSVMERLAYGERSSPLSLSRIGPTRLGSIERATGAHPSPLVLVLDRAEKPGKHRRIARHSLPRRCSGTGVGLIQSANYSIPNAIRASLAHYFPSDPPWHRFRNCPSGWTNIAPVWYSLRGRNSIDVGHGSDRPLAIALGSEAWGLGESWTRPEIARRFKSDGCGGRQPEFVGQRGRFVLRVAPPEVRPVAESSVKMIKLG